jgi:transporter family-2 protein
MSGFNHSIFYALLMLIAGLGIPIMAALNGGLGAKIQSPAFATSILFLVGGVIAFGYMFLSDGMPKSSPVEPIPIYFYFGGFFCNILYS